MTWFRHVSLAVAIFTTVTLQFAQSTPASIAPSGQSNSPQAQDSVDSEEGSAFSDRVANNVLNDIRDGLEGHSSRLMLSAFDGNKMDGYLTFQDQIQAYFERYEGFRVHFRIIQTSTESSRGIVLAEFEIEGSPRGGGPVMRRSSQLRFELERGKKGWKIVDYRPRGFFA